MSRRGSRPAREGATATLVRGTPAPRPLGAVLRVRSSRATPKTFRLRSGSCIFGSTAGCDVVIADPTVSRQHAEIELVPEGVQVRDLGSRNGTFYGGQRVDRIVLSSASSICFGGTEVAVEIDTTSLDDDLAWEGEVYRGMVGRSKAMHRLFATINRLDGSLVPVLISGESGVGKELVARAIRDGSRVAEGPFVAINCGGIARELVASELFGHTRGAYTGAIQARRGAFENADGGTLFLDEIGELPLEVQPMLLRVLETGEVQPVGGEHPRQVRVRCVAATNRDLEQEVEAGRFRGDLFYRLAVVRLTVPPLRDRVEDIEALARHFGRAVGLEDLPPSVVSSLGARPWPGNARELRNAIQAYAALGALPDAKGSKGSGLEAALEREIDVTRPYTEQKDDLTETFTRLYLRALLEHTRGNQTVASKLAGLDRSYLGKLLVRHGLLG